jgi:hypothetical protein
MVMILLFYLVYSIRIDFSIGVWIISRKYNKMMIVMKKILCYVSTVLINVLSVPEAAGFDCVYSDKFYLYKTELEKGTSITINHFVVTNAPCSSAQVASYDVISDSKKKTVKVIHIGCPHAQEVEHIAIIKQSFDNAPDSFKGMKWLGLIASSAD